MSEDLVCVIMQLDTCKLMNRRQFDLRPIVQLLVFTPRRDYLNIM